MGLAMIKFTLACSDGHRFESWFKSGVAYDDLRARNLVTCPECGTPDVEKSVMAPSVATARKASAREKLKALRAHVEANSDYVGSNFASEARAMHLGERPERTIHGEANLAEAKALVAEGVPVMPLPFIPKRKTN
jgi:hypothetical protein